MKQALARPGIKAAQRWGLYSSAAAAAAAAAEQHDASRRIAYFSTANKTAIDVWVDDRLLSEERDSQTS